MAEPERAPADDALAKHLRASLEGMPDGFVLLDRDWRFLYVNEQAERQLQRPREALLGKNMWEEFPEGVGTVADIEYRRVLREGGSTTFELDYPPLNARLEVRAFRTESGGLALYVRDITRAHATQERALLLQAAVAQLDDIVLITEAATPESPTPGIVFVNAAFERVTGYSAAEAQGRSPEFMRGPLTDVSVVEGMRDELRAGRAARGEMIYYAKDGRPIWIDMQLVPFRAPSGQATHVVIVSRDISERKRSEQALRESNERFRIIAQATADVVWDWNLVDDTIWWGDGMRTRFGYAYDNTPQIGESWVQHIHPDDAERVVGGIHAVIDGAGDVWTEEYRFLRADGSAAQVTDRGFVIRDDKGRAVRMVGSMLDVTEQRELEAQLRQSQRLEAVGQLTGGVAHDFNNLLMVISGGLNMLARSPDEEKRDMLMMRMREAVERGANLTKQLLAFSRRHQLSPESIRLPDYFASMSDLLNRSLGVNVRVTVDVSADVAPVLADPNALQLAILNMAVNARDAMDHSGVVGIGARNGSPQDANAACVSISVSDTGAGMTPEVRRRIFEPFFTTKETGKGSGLGLAQVHGFAEQSGGHIEVQSEVGVGTTFTLVLPRGESVPEASAPPAVALEPAPPSGAGEALLVEDDDNVAALTEEMLGHLGWRVTRVASAEAALGAITNGLDVGLVFSDVMMPGGRNGIELAQALRERHVDLPIVLASGYTEAAQRDAERAGLLLLSKPFNLDTLAAAIEAARQHS